MNKWIHTNVYDSRAGLSIECLYISASNAYTNMDRDLLFVFPSHNSDASGLGFTIVQSLHTITIIANC